VRVNDLVEKVQSYAQDADIRMIVDAYLYSAHAHSGQTRKSGEAYLTHPLAVAGILADMRMDVDTIATGLLHDTMEDCMTSVEELTERFGSDVAELVDGVTKIGKLQFRSKQEEQAENFRKMVLAMSRDVRVILVKLADRLHNMRTMEHMKHDRQVAISKETMEIYAPIANRLGLSRLKSELEDLCFKYVEPEVHRDLEQAIEKKAPDHQKFIDAYTLKIESALKDNGVQCRVYGRVKHLVSVYRKMKTQNLNFEQIHDLIAIRVIVDSIGDCYGGLGLIHSLYHHHPDRLKDYIAQPKSNGYQSLHTVIIPEGRQVEVQIRTSQMHQIAEFGIAAHWRYKEGHLALSKDDIQKIARLRALFEAAQDVADPNEFLETVKVDLFAREIFVFTPRGDVKIFPIGATLLDFAYTIHTEVGASCTGGKVDGRMVGLNYQLQSGDRVEILTSPLQKPSRDWLDIAKTGRALSKIRRTIREKERSKGIELGREILEKELGSKKINLKTLQKEGVIDKVARKFGHRNSEQLYLAIAHGTATLTRVMKVISPDTAVQNRSLIPNFINRIRQKQTSPVLINGEGDVMTTFAKCCSPLPGEDILGFITRGKGISVHRSDCKQLLNSEPERRISVSWHQHSKGAHSSELRILCNNQMGMLADLGAACKSNGTNVTKMEAKSIEDNKAILYLEVTISNITELNKLIRSIQKIPGVLNVSRNKDTSRD